MNDLQENAYKQPLITNFIPSKYYLYNNYLKQKLILNSNWNGKRIK